MTITLAARRLVSVSLLVAVVAAAVQCSPAAAEWLQYDRAAVAGGEVWRILTCHLTHWSLDHFFWDTAALLVLGLACEAHSRRKTLGCLAIAAVVIPLSVAWLMPEMHTYRGLSGIDSALFALLAGGMLREAWTHRRHYSAATVGIALSAFAAKTAFEYLTGDTLFVDSAAATMTPLPLVHVVGALIGLANCAATPAKPAPCYNDEVDAIDGISSRKQGIAWKTNVRSESRCCHGGPSRVATW